MRSHNYHARAFTLIELLVVISIISLLIAILLPALTKARQTAQQIQCMSSERQVGVVMSAYLVDSRNWYIPLNYSSKIGWEAPFAKEAGDGVVWSWAWGFREGGYVTDNQLYICPSRSEYLDAKSQQRTRELLSIPHVTSRYRYVSYGYNGNFIGSSYSVDVGPTPARTGDIKRPTETLLFADAERYRVLPPTLPGYSGVRDWHLGGTAANVLWADGHGESIANAQKEYFWDSAFNYKARQYFDRE